MIECTGLGSQGLETIAREWSLSVDALEQELCLLDAADRVVRSNRAMQARAGRLPAEIVGQPCRAAVCQQGTCSPACPLIRARAARRRTTGEVVFGERLYRMTADPVMDSSGAVTGSVVLLSDLTETRRSDLLYRALTGSIPCSVLMLDGNLRVVLANRNFLVKSRRSESDTLGQPLERVLPDVILSEMELESQIRQAFGGSPPEPRRLTYRAPGVPIRVYYYSIVPVALGPRVDHVLLLIDDISEQSRLSEEIRRMERHLASVVESASDLVVSVDSAGRIITWNKAAERISGYPLEEVKSRPLMELLEIGPDASDPFQRGAVPDAAEWGLRTRDGRLRPVSWVISRMTDGQSRTHGYVAVGRDLTERRKFEQQLQQSQKLAALGVMAGGIAHEIRTPLTISSSAAQFLLEDDLTPEFRRECARKVYDGIRRASTIIEDLLRFGRPSGNMERSGVDLATVLGDAVLVISNQAAVNNVRVIAAPADAPLMVLGVASLLQQVFVNLLLNAIQAMPGGGTVEVQAAAVSGQAVIRVADTGHGISPEDVDRIFDPFYTRDSAGTGLGLSLCYSILKQHMGSISVKSEPDKGAVFTIALPLI